MDKNFNFKTRELELYQSWEKKGLFNPDLDPKKKPFSVVLPPPNVTGRLHMGHALNVTLQDAIIRYKHMKGFDTLWVPGTDHAGIATQNVVEKELEKQGIQKDSLSREAFIKKTWEWKETHGHLITTQLRQLGGAISWQFERFTLDDTYQKAVQSHFVDLYKKGLIYKGKRMINWCPKNKTAISDIEVDYKEQQGHLYYIHYPQTPGKEDGITVATTRPETLFGDVAVAIHPDDSRYKHLIGKTVLVAIQNKKIPIICDPAVEKDFGTGAVKITPAHDANDYELGKRHKLDMPIILDELAHMTGDIPKDYLGLDRYACRKKVTEALKESKQLLNIEELSHQVGISSRSGAVIEPMLSEQWFVDMNRLVKPALDAVKSGHIQFIPSRWVKAYLDWMENIQDWCISRQIWWGHRIPVWYKNDDIYCGLEAPKGEGWQQEDDVLDTWFSSALWPFATLGWPDKTDTLSQFYPTASLFTGYDIITFWVSRMITMGLAHMKDIPFNTVYIHGLVRDSTGKKMSKSSGNVVDPLELINSYGADALRFSLAKAATLGGQDITFSEDQVKACRNFGNKIWNATNYLFLCLETQETPIDILTLSEKTTPEDLWILDQLNGYITEISTAFENYNLAQASDSIWHFSWDKLCDWYIELTKNRKTEAAPILAFCILKTLSLLHPLMPFITEELFLNIKAHPNIKGLEDIETLFDMPWPTPILLENTHRLAEQFQNLTDLIRCIRDVKKDAEFSPKDRPHLYLEAPKPIQKQLEPLFHLMVQTAQVKDVSWLRNTKDSTWVSGISKDIVFYMPASLSAKQAQENRFKKQEEHFKKEIDTLNKKLKNANFLQKAPKNVVLDIQEKHK